MFENIAGGNGSFIKLIGHSLGLGERFHDNRFNDYFFTSNYRKFA